MTTVVRYLFGPVLRDLPAGLEAHRASGRCFVHGDRAGVDFAVAPDASWETVLERLPTGWTAEYVIGDASGGPVPAWAWSAPWPVVGVAAASDQATPPDRRDWTRFDRVVAGPIADRLWAPGTEADWDALLDLLDRERPAIVARAVGRRAAAALDRDPFDLEAARSLARSLENAGDHQGLLGLARDRLRLAQSAPELVPIEPWFAQPHGGERLSRAGPRLDREPGPRPRVSLCMIVKNEESNLGQCLAGVVDLVDEVVVVDTGSTDRTRELAASLGGRVFEFPWIDDFAAARNASIERACGEWIFWLDADDRLDPDNRRKLRDLFANPGAGPDAHVMNCRCLPDPRDGAETIVDHVRLFPNDPRVRWRYPVHEQILPALRKIGARVHFSDVVIDHVGYQDRALRRSKLERDLRILLRQAEATPDDPFVLFNLGSIDLELGRIAQAIPRLERSLALSHPRDSITRKLHALLAQARRRLNQAPQALEAARAGRAVYPDDVELLFQESLILREMGDLAGAEARLRRLIDAPATEHFKSVDPGLKTYKARHNLAVVCRQQGRPDEAESLWRSVTRERPDFLPAWLLLGESLLARNDQAALNSLFQAAPAVIGRSSDFAVLQARARLRLGDPGRALALLDHALQAWPGAIAPRLLKSQIFIRDHADPAAVQAALRDLLAVDPSNEFARRHISKSAPDHPSALNT